MLKTILPRIASLVLPSCEPGSSKENPIEILAIPGLMTLLDVALYRTVEGELAATICSSHMLLQTWLDVKRQAIIVLQELVTDTSASTTESFARACLEAACDAIERMSTDRLAQSANLSDPFESLESSSTTTSADDGNDTGRRLCMQRPRDCWETSRLQCIDYCWADDAANLCQRLLRHLHKHPFLSDNKLLTREANLLTQLVLSDLPTRLLQFRTAMEAEAVVSKRLYLVKCEYRAPFRAFLEAHQSVLRAPSLTLLEEYVILANKNSSKRRDSAKDRLQSLLENPALIEALALEQRCEEYEGEMQKALFSFCELARYLEQRKARLKQIPGILNAERIVHVTETLRRLRLCNCRKTGPDTSTGIRPLLLDLQGVARDEDATRGDREETLQRLGRLVKELSILGRLCEVKHAFVIEKKSDHVDLPSSIVRGCTQFDAELFQCHFEDWYSCVSRQQELTQQTDFDMLAEKLRRAEMQMSLAVAPPSSLEVVRERVKMITADREKRFEVMKEMIEEVCLREMNWHVRVSAPEKTQPLVLQPTSALGVFGLPLQMAGERLPIG